jgi:hypothetical protein
MEERGRLRNLPQEKNEPGCGNTAGFAVMVALTGQEEAGRAGAG